MSSEPNPTLPSALRIAAVTAFLVGWFPLQAARQPPRPNTLAIVDVDVIHVDTGSTARRHTVLVEGDRITAIGPSATVAVPRGARRVNGSKHWLIPGLWDMHVHTSNLERDFALYLAHGITSVRDMGGEDPDHPSRTPGIFSVAWSRLRVARDAVRAGEQRGPTIVAGGVMLDGPTPWPGARRVANESEARTIVRMLHRDRVDFIKVGGGIGALFPAVADEARRVGLPVAGHAPAGSTALAAVAAGMRSVEHLTGLPPGCFQEANPDASCAQALAGLAREGAWSTPTLIAWRGRLAPPEPSADWPGAEYVGETLRSAWRADPAAQRRATGAFAQYVAAAGHQHRAGIRLLAGTDSAVAFVVPGLALHQELRLLVDAGLTPSQALASATEGPARFLGLEQEVGRIAVGQRADLVLLDEDPLADIRSTARIRAVVTRGELLDRNALDQLLATASRAR